jgi:type II secretion system protein L
VTAAILIKTNAGGEYEWLHLSETHQSTSEGDIAQLAQAGVVDSNRVFIVPAESILLRKISYENSERSIYRKTIPYSLEDDIVDDIDEMHFSFGEAKNNKVLVAAIKRTGVDRILESFQQEKLEIQQLIPELLVIPYHGDGWTVLVDGKRWLIRTSETSGFALEEETASLGLQLALDEAEQLPEKLYLYTSEVQYEETCSHLPEILKGKVEWEDQDYWGVVAQNYPVSNALNMLQGDYARSLPWHKWRKQWQLTLIVLAVTLIFQFGSGLINQSLLETENTRLRSQIETAYKQVVPRGAIVDAETQLRRKVNAMKGSNSEGFVSLLDRASKVIAATKEVSIKSMNYSEQQSEIRITLLVPSFKDVDIIRSKLEQIGLKATMTGSSEDGGKIRAGLRIKS